MDHRFTRRRFLANAPKCALGSWLLASAQDLFAALPGPASSAAQISAYTAQTSSALRWPTDAHGMIVYSEEYVTREMPITLLDSWLTPTDHFFVRNNEHMPQINVADWRLSITGEVVRPLMLTMAELLKIEPRSVTNTLECAGNGRAFFQPRIRGVPWTRGGVGNAAFRGPSLAALLQKAEPKSGARHVAFRGLAPASPYPPFVRSIPLHKALDPDTIVATEMNGAELSPEHGYPARALVPGWIGSASIKWLTEARVLANEVEGYFMDSAYRLPVTRSAEIPDEKTDNAKPGAAITSLPVKSIIASPADGVRIGEPGIPVRIFGAAWAGESAVARVEVSTDGGHSWQKAMLGKEQARYAWRLWSLNWIPKREGDYVILSRATDDRGQIQPLQMRWNPGGYIWNAVDRIRVTVGKSSR